VNDTALQPAQRGLLAGLERLLAFVLAATWIASPLSTVGAAQKSESFEVRLAPAPRDTAMREIIAGKGTAKITLVGNELTVAGTFEGLRSPATQAHVHQAFARGVRGPAVYELTVSKATDGTITGSVTLSAEARAGLDDGRLYIEIDSEKAPDGNLWGWLLR